MAETVIVTLWDTANRLPTQQCSFFFSIPAPCGGLWHPIKHFQTRRQRATPRRLWKAIVTLSPLKICSREVWRLPRAVGRTDILLQLLPLGRNVNERANGAKGVFLVVIPPISNTGTTNQHYRLCITSSNPMRKPSCFMPFSFLRCSSISFLLLSLNRSFFVFIAFFSLSFKFSFFLVLFEIFLFL